MILDEIHHAGDALSWGDGVREAFEPADAAAGADRHAVPLRQQPDPVRRPTTPDGDGMPRSRRRLHLRLRRRAAPTASCGRCCSWPTRGEMQLAHQRRRRDRRPARRAADQGPDRAGLAHRAGPARRVDARRCSRAADQRLTEVRRHVPDAGGLVIATDQDPARAYAELLRDDHRRDADRRALRRRRRRRKRIAAFAAGDDRWMVAVRMVSEGVDVPRLAVGVYATTHLDAAVLRPGRRPVRAGPAPRRDGVGLPAVACPTLLGLASEMEVERDHVLDRPKSDDDEDSSPPRSELLAAGQPQPRRPRRRATSCRSRRWSPRRTSTRCSTTAASSAIGRRTSG